VAGAFPALIFQPIFDSKLKQDKDDGMNAGYDRVKGE
jgi:hypothetical protein